MTEIYINSVGWLRAVMICGPFVTIIVMWGMFLFYRYMVKSYPREFDLVFDNKLRKVIREEIASRDEQLLN